MNYKTKSPGRRNFIKNVIFTGTGVAITPTIFSCSSKGIGKGARDAASDDSNLLYNGDFNLPDSDNPVKPAGWDIGPVDSGASVILSRENVHSGANSVLQTRTVTADYYFYMRQKVELQPGDLYRLRFYAKADDKSKDLFAVCVSASGSEGPAWLYRPVHLKSTDSWQEVDIVFRAQSGFNPLHSADIEFRLNQWRPDFPFRPNRPQDRDVQQNLFIDSASLVKLKDGTRVPGRLSPWILVPGHDKLRVAEVELGMGDGISAVNGSVRLLLNGNEMTSVNYLEDIVRPGQFAYSERSKKIFVLNTDTEGDYDLSYEAIIIHNGDTLLGMPQGTDRVLRDGSKHVTRIQMECDAKVMNRVNWPVTQGVPFPPGVLADLSTIRILDPEGSEIPAQVKATSYWADDSVRWALLDFCINAPSGKSVNYILEFGPGIQRSDVPDPVKLTDNVTDLLVDAGRVKFRVSKSKFRLLEDLMVDGRPVLNEAALLSLTEGNGKIYSTEGEQPYTFVVEESGPLRVVIAVLGWNTNSTAERFLTYTTRIHVYRNQPFVKVFHTLTNRHEEQIIGDHRYARGWPKDESQFLTRKIPQRNIADATLKLKPKDISDWTFITKTDTITGNVREGSSSHHQVHHGEGVFTTPHGKINTEDIPGIIRITGTQGSLTAAVYRYSNLFPKEVRISSNALELGLIPFSSAEPHALIRGTARTSELLLSFDLPGSDAGLQAARCFTDPTFICNREWYCASRGFMTDALIPENKYTTGTYDRMIRSYVDNCSAPYPKGIDDCGLMNFGDYTYGGYNIWVNMEYDSDLGLYMHFARSGDRRAIIRGIDGSRHFLDADTGWYTGEFDTHGANFPHDVAHYAPTRPGGHIYTLGLIHYFLLTGDRRALEATRMATDCVHRTLYHRLHQYSSLFTEDDPVGPKRGYMIPGGSSRSANSRNTSDPSRYAVHSYLVTGEARFLEAALSIAESFVLDWPEVWRTDDDQYMHYRWPQIIGRLYDITGAQHFRDTLLKCGKWMLEVPYARYGEFRAAQSYGSGVQVPSRQNNTRMLFLTAWAWKITGERKYLDWMINMFDAQIEQERHNEIYRADGKSLGKDADNPARGLAWITPYRTVLLEPSPERFQIVPPGESVWKLAIGNTSETALRGKLVIGPLPHGVFMETTSDFELALGQEISYEFPVKFTREVADGRITIPYRVTTKGTDGREGERNGFFAAHILRRRTEQVPEIIFHAPLDSKKPAFSFGGNGVPIIEVEHYVQGRKGKALGEKSEGWSFDLSGSIFPDAGTFSVWIKPASQRNIEHGLLRILGHGWPFIGIYTSRIVACNQAYNFVLASRLNEWIHVAIKWDLTELAYYIDGKSVYKEKRINFEIPTGELWALPQNAAAFEDLKIYSVALSDEQILTLAKE